MYEIPFHSKPLSELSFLVTGGAGFIGSHLVEYLLKYKAKKVRVLDNLLTGKKENVELFSGQPGYEFLNGDIRDYETCLRACEGTDFIFHEAALGSVQRSIKDPIQSHNINATGFINILWSAKASGVRRIVFASSSSVYGDHTFLPKKEDIIGNPLSPYAVTKLSNEQYAMLFSSLYSMEIIGLRYFNIFGPRQDPNGPYAAVIPAFIRDLLNDVSPVIYGDGTQTRDFTFVENAVQANIQAILTQDKYAINQVYNIAAGEPFSVLELVDILKNMLIKNISPRFLSARKGDILHSYADISKARQYLKYRPDVNLNTGLRVLTEHIQKF
ncbi:MAG: SDR family oxidoreductase [Chitinophagales bacterium]|nr:SDR family oxidoreductase [Chitinophagales bacterium]